MVTTMTTCDFYLAAFLLTEDIPLVGHTRDQIKSTFEFEGNGLSDLINEFYTDMVRVSPQRYGRAIRDLKAIMYNNTTFQPHSKNGTGTERKDH